MGHLKPGGSEPGKARCNTAGLNAGRIILLELSECGSPSQRARVNCPNSGHDLLIWVDNQRQLHLSVVKRGGSQCLAVLNFSIAEGIDSLQSDGVPISAMEKFMNRLKSSAREVYEWLMLNNGQFSMPTLVTSAHRQAVTA